MITVGELRSRILQLPNAHRRAEFIDVLNELASITVAHQRQAALDRLDMRVRRAAVLDSGRTMTR